MSKMSTYRTLTDEALANVYATGSEVEQKAVLAEMARRDRRDAQKATDKVRWAQVKNEWLLIAEAQHNAAEAATNGYMLSAAGREAGISTFDLWTGSDAQAAKFASEELLEHWESNPRLTVSAFQAQQRADRRAMREQSK
jgi:hypothetical protein